MGGGELALLRQLQETFRGVKQQLSDSQTAVGGTTESLATLANQAEQYWACERVAMASTALCDHPHLKPLLLHKLTHNVEQCLGSLQKTL